MSSDPQESPRPLPERPDLRHLKDQAKDLLKAGQATSLAKAQFQVAPAVRLRELAQAQGPRRIARSTLGQLKQAIDANDLERVKELMTRHPELHRAPLGYGKNGPLTWVAECRVPRVPPGETRLAMARWMIENGSDVHQGGDGPLMRAALRRYAHPHDGAAGRPRRRRERRLGRPLPHHPRPVRDVRARALKMADRPRCRPARGGQVSAPGRDDHLHLFAERRGQERLPRDRRRGAASHSRTLR